MKNQKQQDIEYQIIENIKKQTLVILNQKISQNKIDLKILREFGHLIRNITKAKYNYQLIQNLKQDGGNHKTTQKHNQNLKSIERLKNKIIHNQE